MIATPNFTGHQTRNQLKPFAGNQFYKKCATMSVALWKVFSHNYNLFLGDCPIKFLDPNLEGFSGASRLGSVKQTYKTKAASSFKHTCCFLLYKKIYIT
ncbi:MAG: hypothetical protein ACK5QS_17530 [Pseudanabaenaceae cyanobacterium]